MNQAAFHGAALWDITQEAHGSGMTMKAYTGELPLLEACAERTGCTLEILRRGGLPQLLGRLRGRQAWLAGLLSFALGLYLLSSFVWMIEVEGNERLTDAEILAACRELGLRPGAWKGQLDMEEITNQLLLQFADISWVSVGIQGTDVTIRLVETIAGAQMIDKTTPCDIVAAEAGVILQITAERGTPLVAPGDVVQKGDILISSEILIGLEGEEQHTEYVAAEGSVMVRLWKSLTEEMPFSYEEKQYSGAPQENRSLLFGGQEWDFFHPDSSLAWEKTILSEKHLALGDWALPIGWRRESWQAFELMERTRTPEEAKALLEENLRKKAEKILSPYGTIEDMTIDFTEYADGIRAEAKLTLLERIAEKRERTEREWESADGAIRENLTDGE